MGITKYSWDDSKLSTSILSYISGIYEKIDTIHEYLYYKETYDNL